VKWNLTGTFADPTIAVGSTATLKGSVKPVRSGTKVVLQRLSGSTWSDVGTKTAGTNGAYAFSVKGSKAGTVHLPGARRGHDAQRAVQTGSRVLT
jgi:hypothetical protein